MNSVIMNDDCLAALRKLESNSLDSLVTDPPAGISFMGKDWDSDLGGREQWVAWMTDVMSECLRVLKPGAHGLVWAIPRTSHWTATALENAGFEIRDVVTHLFGTGFPKSLDVSKAIDKAAGAERIVTGPQLRPDGSFRTNVEKKEGDVFSVGSNDKMATAPATEAAKLWQGWGTALKPASEHWILVRKPCSEKTVAANVLKWGTGALNIDACRVATTDNLNGGRYSDGKQGDDGAAYGTGINLRSKNDYVQPNGRFPANLVLDEEAAAALDEQSLAGGMHSAGSKASWTEERKSHESNCKDFAEGTKTRPQNRFGDSGGASRFFYVAKASKKDKGEGNTHPTVKSTELMSYLCKLVTPPKGTVLDPFMGSGSTGVAAKCEGFSFVGIEREAEYIKIAQTRMDIAPADSNEQLVLEAIV